MVICFDRFTLISTWVDLAKHKNIFMNWKQAEKREISIINEDISKTDFNQTLNFDY